MADITSDQTEISYAESVTSWSGDSFSLDNEIFVEGSNAVSCIQTTNGTNTVTYTGGPWNMAGKHVRLYMSSNIMPNTDVVANGGIEATLGDGTNTAVWTIGGSDTYGGGWQDFFFYADSSPTSGTVNTGAVTSVSINLNTVTKPRNSVNGWYDNWRFGNGLTINSTTTEAIDFQDVADADILKANAWNILQETDGVLFGKGKLTLGDTGTKNCNLVSVNETLYFIDRNVAATLYAIVVQEGTGATDIDISGLVCKTVGTSGAELDFSTAITSFALKSSNFSDMGTMQFNTGTTVGTNFTNCGTTDLLGTHAATTCKWVTSGQIDLNTGGTLTSCVIDSCTAASSVLTSDLEDLDECHFISDGSNHAVELTSIGTGTMTWNCTEASYVSGATGSPVTPTSTGNETIYVNVVTASNLTINVASGASIPSIRVGASFTGSVNVVAGQVTFTVTAKDINTGALLQNAMVYVTAAAGGSLTEGTAIINKVLTDINGEASVTQSYGSDQPITGVVRKSTATPFYKTSPVAGTISSASGLSLTIQMIPDE